MKDLRDMSASQWHEPMELDDWMVAIFGGDQQVEPSESTASSSAPLSIGEKENKKNDL